MKPQPSGGFEWVQAAGGPALVCGALRPLADHLFTTRQWALGSQPVSRDQDWEPVAASLGVDAAHLVRLHQVHGAAVEVRRAGQRPAGAADCVPLLMADAATGAIAAAHAGWRGLAAGVPAVTVAALAREFGSAPEQLVAAVGPSISAERYEVGADVRTQFEAGGFAPEQIARWFLPGARPDHWLFDEIGRAHV